MAYGERDFPHLMRQAEAMEAALKAAGGEVSRILLPGRDHFSASYAGGEPAGPWVPAAIDWMNKQP
jgi:acetyl esterase/lipase